MIIVKLILQCTLQHHGGSSKMFLELLLFKIEQLERKRLSYTSIYMYSAGHLKVLLIFFSFHIKPFKP